METMYRKPRSHMGKGARIEILARSFHSIGPWLLEDSGDPVYRTGDPVTFWNQLQRV